MRIKVGKLTERLASSLSAKDGVECVMLGEAAENDILDPYFSLILDAYFSGGIPPLEERLAIYGRHDHFETDIDGAKDRFFLDDVPVHVNLAQTAAVDALLSANGAPNAVLRETGTHRFYRLVSGQTLFSRSGWISGVQAALGKLDDGFWTSLSAAYRSKMEHSLSDIGASIIRGDDYFFALSTVDFLKSAASSLFALNRRFEPPHRFLEAGLKRLPSLPDSFLPRWESLLRCGGDATMERKYEISKLLAKSILNLA